MDPDCGMTQSVFDCCGCVCRLNARRQPSASPVPAMRLQRQQPQQQRWWTASHPTQVQSLPTVLCRSACLIASVTSDAAVYAVGVRNHANEPAGKHRPTVSREQSSKFHVIILDTHVAVMFTCATCAIRVSLTLC
jgi:hypothetical protein